MKKILTSILALLCLAPLAKAQTNSNPLTSLLQNTVIDTNSAFWQNEKMELRATTQTTINKYESALGLTYFVQSPSTPTGTVIGLGAEIVNGAVNAIDAAYATAEFGYAVHNVKLTGVFGAGYDNVNRAVGFEVGGRVAVSISQNMFADVEALWNFNTRSFNSQNQSGTARVGLGFKF